MILLKGGFVIDTLNLDIKKNDVLIDKGIIKRIGRISAKVKKVINLEGKFVAPALLDMHVHCRVPGKEYAEDFFSVSKAAIRGGISSIVAMPNTTPVTDNVNILKRLIRKVRKESTINVFFTSAITQAQEGKYSVNVEANSKYVVGFSDDGKWVLNIELMADVMKRAFKKGKIILSHPQFPYPNGVINEGRISKKLNLLGIPVYTEYIAVFRDCMIAIIEDLPLHLQHLSSLVSVDIVRMAKKINPKITAETCPHYFWFSEDDVKNPNFKMNPPLRTKKDVEGIIEGILDGSIDVIATDHAPHTVEEKKLSFDRAPFGVIGLETLLPASIDKLHIERKIPLAKIIRMMSLNPAKICRVDYGFLKEGDLANICVFSFKNWRYTDSCSKSLNTPFLGMEFKTKVEMVFVNGKLVYEDDRFYI